MTGLSRIAILLLGASLAAGCASSTGVGHARLLEDGESQWGAGLELNLSSAKLSPGHATPAPWPQLSVGYRRGVAGLELGARAWGFGLPYYVYTVGLAADVKLPIARAASHDEGFDLSIGFDTGYHQINVAKAPTHVLFAQIPLTLGYNLGGGDQVVVGLRVFDQLMLGADQHAVNMFFFGGSIGYVWQALDFIEIRPELVIMHSPVSFNGLSEDDRQRGLTIVQIGLGSAIAL